MSDPLERLLKRTDEWEPPPADPGAVKGRGKKLKVRRAVFSGSLASLVLVGGVGGVFLLNQERTVTTVLRPEKSSDSPEMRAKAATFAFHALFEAGPYEVDYQGIESTDEGWISRFVSGPPVEELDRRVELHKQTVQEFQLKVDELRIRLKLKRESGASQKVLRSLREEVERYENNLPLARADVRAAEEALEETIDTGGPHVTEIEVVEQDGVFMVANLEGPYEGTKRSLIEGFEEEVPRLAIGYEFFGIETNREAGLGWNGQAIYVGPLPSSDVTRCGLDLYDLDGRLVARTAEDRYWEAEAPENEERRDGIGAGAGLEQIVGQLPPDEELRPVTVCEPFLRNQSGSPTTRGFDRLQMELELESDIVQAGGTVGSVLHVRNDSGEVISDPECRLSAWRFGLVPRDNPTDEIWQAVVVDCGGRFRIEPGFVDTFQGQDFRATTPTGEPLPPGEYLAVVEIEGRGERLTAPVTVTAE